ncbi:hypothetical protein Gotur_027732 [Gossypium turneri]
MPITSPKKSWKQTGSVMTGCMVNLVPTHGVGLLWEPIRGWFSDARVTMIGEVKNHEEWEKIEQFEMASEFDKRPEMMVRNVGFRYCWVFVRHPKWRINELPWEQWTLVGEVVLEAKKTERLDKWSLMGRLGNKARSLIAQCAARMRPDIIYV